MASRLLSRVINWSIAITALLLVAVLAYPHLRPERKIREQPKIRAIDELGFRLPASLLNWQANGRTLLVAVGPDCADCQARATFFRQLIADSALRRVAVVTMAEPPPEAAATMLAAMGIESNHLLLVPFRRVRLRSVPALILVDAGGTVVNVWKGRFDEAAVLAGLQ